MNFGQAVESLKKGRRVARTGWNGKGMWLMYIGWDDWDIADKHSYAEQVDGLKSCAFIAMKTADSQLVPWLASQTDVLAEDWVLFDAEPVVPVLPVQRLLETLVEVIDAERAQKGVTHAEVVGVPEIVKSTLTDEMNELEETDAH